MHQSEAIRRLSGLSDIDDNTSTMSELTSGSTFQQQQTNGNNGVRRTSFTTGSITGSTKSFTGNAGAAGQNALKQRRIQRKSIFDTSQLAMTAGNIAGRNLLTADMLEYSREYSADSVAVGELRTSSILNPAILLGWQVINQIVFCFV